VYLTRQGNAVEDQQIFNWDRSDANAAFNWDINQYERLIEYCLVASDYQLLEWGLDCHKQYVHAQDIRNFYPEALEQRWQSSYQELHSMNPEAAAELSACYNYLIQLLRAA